jgi:hypothetical protein
MRFGAPFGSMRFEIVARLLSNLSCRNEHRVTCVMAYRRA